MGLKDVLQKMRIVEQEAPKPASPQSVPRDKSAPPPRVNLDDVLKSVAPARLDEKKLPKPQAGSQDASPTFPEIYRAAGVVDPMHGFTAFKVLEILSSDHFAELDARARAAALAGFLQMNPNGPVAVADVIQDALRRDQALDEYERFLRKKLDARAQQADQANAALQAEIDDIVRRNKEKMEENRRALDEEQRRFGEWQAKKRIEERRLFDAVAAFVEENPVSLGG